MRTYLVTGGAGFIGSNYIHYMFKKYGDEIRIINVDVLTYAGNLENLKDIERETTIPLSGRISAIRRQSAGSLPRMILTGWCILRRRAMWTEASAIRRCLCRPM